MARGQYWKPDGYDSINNAAKINNIPPAAMHRAIRAGALPVYRFPANKLVRFVKLDEVEAAFTPRQENLTGKRQTA